MDSSKLDPEDPLAQKALVVFCMRIMPLLLAPMATISTSRIAGWCINWHSAKRSSDKQSKEVNKNLERFLQVKRVETTYSLVDYVSFLCFTHCMIVWFKAVHFGLASLPTFDLSIIPSSSAFLLLVALFHSGFVPRSSWSATVLAVAYNLVLLHNQYGIIVFGVVDRETLMIIVRLFAGFFVLRPQEGGLRASVFYDHASPCPCFSRFLR